MVLRSVEGWMVPLPPIPSISSSRRRSMDPGDERHEAARCFLPCGEDLHLSVRIN